jgi:predicted alpha/beta-hydrolase family hydrolase
MTLEPRQIAVEAGRTVSAVIARPPQVLRRPATLVILAHGAGNNMHSPFLSAVHEGIAAHGYVTVKFNFPYTEAGRRAPDSAPVLEACYRRLIEAVRSDQTIAARRIVIGGKSLGGRIATHLAAQGEEVAGAVLLGYPLHPPGQPGKLRVAHLQQIRAPLLFFAGTRDTLCTLDLLKRTLRKMPASTELHVIEGGDHSFNVPKSMRRDAQSIWDEIVGVTARWLEALPTGRV